MGNLGVGFGKVRLVLFNDWTGSFGLCEIGEVCGLWALRAKHPPLTC